MSLDWPSESYVRVYIRDTPGWLVAPWEARAFLPLLLRKLDRNGRLDLGDDGTEGLAATVQLPLVVVEVAYAYWLKRGTVVPDGTVLVMPNYLEAQECSKTDKLRAQEYRDRARVTKRDGGVTKRDESSQNVTDPSRVVTDRHESSRGVGIVTLPVLPVPPSPCRDSDPPGMTHTLPSGCDSPDELPSSVAPGGSPQRSDLPVSAHESQTRMRGSGGMTPPPETILITPELLELCRTRFRPCPTEADVQECLSWHRREGKGSADWGESVVWWMGKAKSFREASRARQRAGPKLAYIQPSAPFPYVEPERFSEEECRKHGF